MSWFPIAAIATLAALGLPIPLAAHRVRRSSLQVGSRVKIDADRIPGAPRAALDAEIGRLRSLGFALCAYERVQPFVRARCADVWGATCWNEAWRTFAVSTTSAQPRARRPVAVHFWSLLRDGSRLLTTNGEAWSVFGDDPRTELADPYVQALAARCDAHFERLRALPPMRHPVRAEHGQLVDALREDARTRLAGMTAAGDLVENGDGAWDFTWRGALRTARALRRAE